MGLHRSVVRDRRALLLQETEDSPIFLTDNSRAERAEFLPFFAEHDQLCAYLAPLNSPVSRADVIAHEFSPWGDLVCRHGERRLHSI